MGIHHSPHTHPVPIPMRIPMGIPIPTAALLLVATMLLHKSQQYIMPRHGLSYDFVSQSYRTCESAATLGYVEDCGQITVMPVACPTTFLPAN